MDTAIVSAMAAVLGSLVGDSATAASVFPAARNAAAVAALPGEIATARAATVSVKLPTRLDIDAACVMRNAQRRHDAKAADA